ncbi:GNAT family N-acetyltransferase [Methylomonas sp. DH-1]|uniref:GNAT family N-acetyltransferase n=1 Tax=Methylomonas sp. (strain DH-1) TaxID=1727196 RepID=UPI001E2B9FD6|nr:GNAT family N-acetyltransferase [Methylomonas sp. DH-1]
MADANDAEALAQLINSAYRGETSRLGWTTEADLLDGRRIDAAGIFELLAESDSLILACKWQTQLLGSVHLRHAARQVHIGMLAVSPAHQGQGIGKQLLQQAEQWATRIWPVRVFVMAVIPQRRELIEFYQRRGYRSTGRIEPFPENPALWTPKVGGLCLKLLEKPVQQAQMSLNSGDY